MKKIILFDFFGVISSEVAPRWFEKFFDKEEAKRIKDEIVTPGDLGLITEEEIYTSVAQKCGVSKVLVKESWYTLAQIDCEMVEFIKKLKTEHPVYLISNAIGSFLKTIIYNNNLENLFDKTFISSEIGLKKPSSEFFRYCLNEIGVSPSDCIFTDDNYDNILAAKGLGIESILYTGLKDLKEKLASIE